MTRKSARDAVLNALSSATPYEVRLGMTAQDISRKTGYSTGYVRQILRQIGPGPVLQRPGSAVYGPSRFWFQA